MFGPKLAEDAQAGDILIERRPSRVWALFLVVTVGGAQRAVELKCTAGDPRTAARLRGLTLGSRTPEEAERRLAPFGF